MRIVRAARRTMQTMAEGEEGRGAVRPGLRGEYNYIMNSITI